MSLADSSVFKHHLHRIRQETTRRLGRAEVANWITENTFVAGKPFSFAGHEYQQKILEDTSQEIVIIKGAQLGLSELALRLAAALMSLMPANFSLGYTLPTAGAVTAYSKTRFDPIVRGSPALRAGMSEGSLDNSEVKEFAGGRMLYFKGASVGGQAISTTLHATIHDELDFSDQEVIGDYTSRMIHSEYKWRWKFSTPTFPGGPIDAAFKASRRHFNFCKCDKCGHQFLPDYFEHVRIPGFYGDLRQITKHTLPGLRYQDASLHCPKCGRIPSLLPEHREWVIENDAIAHIAGGYSVSPFDAPTIITVPYLITASTSYSSISRFVNFNLGKAAEDSDSGLTVEDIDTASYKQAQSPFHTHVMGIDLGTTCHFVVAGMDQLGVMHIVHYERCLVGEFRATYARLEVRFRVVLKVSDTQPYVETILQMQESDPNLFGSFYVKKQGLDLYEVKVRDPDSDSALSALRQVSVNRNAVLDRLLTEFRSGHIQLAQLDDFEMLKAHLTDMKRMAAKQQNGEFASHWVKSVGGQDHYHHAVLYCWIAAQMRGLASGGLQGINLGVGSFKVTQPPTRK